MHIAAVVFDMDGLMLDTEPIIKSCIQRAAAELGAAVDDEFYSGFVGRGTADFDAGLVGRFGSALPLEELKIRWSSSIRTHFATSGIPLKLGLLDLLSFLDERGIPMAVATSTDADDAALCLKVAGVAERFSVVVAGDQVAQGKPRPDIYLTAASRLGVDASDCIAIEDSSSGVLAATSAGMRTFMVPDGGRSPSAEARMAAFRVVSSLSEVRAAIAKWLV